jgi:branched-chain amino acid transport system ATP-binding protein
VGELSAHGIEVRFEGVVALAGVDLTLSDGEVFGLIGPNGAGKTTLINCLTGFQKPTVGTVRQDGTDITGWRPERIARNGLSRTFQGVRLFAGLTVRDNVELGALCTARRMRAAKAHAAAVIEWLELDPVANQPAGSLPYGLERRVAFARALASEPRYLLLDEPAAGMNENESAELAQLIEGARARLGCAVLLIEHDVEFVLRLSDRVHVLDHGTTLTVGAPHAIRTDPRVIRAYLGAQPVLSDA